MNGGIGAEIVLPFLSSISKSHLFDSLYTYGSCGSCGYELNLNSCNRTISAIDADYSKSMRRGIIAFFSIDESRFNQTNKIRWLPSKKSWKLFQRRIKLLCKNCGNYIGTAWNVKEAAAWDGIPASRVYEIKIRSLRPLMDQHS